MGGSAIVDQECLGVLLQRFICHHGFRMGPQECRPCLCRFPLVSSPKGIEAVE